MKLVTKTVAVAALLALGAPRLAAADSVDRTATASTGGIRKIMVIDLENESYASTFGAGSPASFLNGTLVPKGELLVNYFATGHVSLDNYVAQISGQEPTVDTGNDCINLATLNSPPTLGAFGNVTPGTDTTDPAAYPGQVVGNGCVYPAPTATTHGAQTIGDQLDMKYNQKNWHAGQPVHWREYAEDMANNTTRDHGDPDPMGGADCAHPPVGGNDDSNSASATDQYATRHNGFMYFHSVIDNAGSCNAHVVPLGTLTVGAAGAPDAFAGHLYNDLQSVATTPDFMFVTPNLCDDGHDASCAGPNVEGTVDSAGKNIGGLTAADLWLKHWVPMIMNAPAYETGELLIVITLDEAGVTDTRACAARDQSTCKSPTGPNTSNPGFSQILGRLTHKAAPTANFVYPGGGQVGALLLNRTHIKAGTLNTTGVYNHFSALRSYEDLLGITGGGDDGLGHLGYAATAGMLPFGKNVFNK